MILKSFRSRGHRLRRAGQRRRIVWGCIAFALCLLFWFSPAMIGSRLVWPKVIGYLTANFPGRVETRATRLGWLSPVELRDVKIEDAEGRPLTTIGVLRTDKSLLGLLCRPREVGVVRIERPQLSVQIRENGSNLEDMLAGLLGDASTSGSVSGIIEIADGSANIISDGPAPEVQIEQITASVELPTAEQEQISIRLARCKVRTLGREGACSAEVRWQRGPTAPGWSVSAQLESIGLPLVTLAAHRFGQPVTVDGALTATVRCSGGAAARGVTLDIQRTEVRSLRVAAPTWLGQDELSFDTCTAAGRCVWRNGSWEFTSAQLACDAGRVSIDGRFTWCGPTTTSFWRGVAASASAADLKLSGNVDLARLAQSLPHTMRIREGVEVESGALQFHFAGAQQSAGRSYLARLEASDLSARRDGHRYTWKQPLRLNLDAAQTSEGWHVQQLECRAAFADLSGAGSQQRGSLGMRCDLDEFVAQWQQFVDLGGLRAGGVVIAQLDWQLDKDGRATVTGTGRMDQFQLITGSGTLVREPQLTAKLAFEGNTQGNRIVQVQSGRIEVESATDRLDLQLLEPVADPSVDTVWSFGCRLTGQLASWWSRVQAFSPSLAADAAGTVQLEAISRLSSHAIELEKASVRCEPLRIRTPQLNIDEPLVAVNVAGRWDVDTGRWTIPEGTFQSAALACRITDAALNLRGPTSRMTGNASLRADLAQWQSSWQIPGRPVDWRMSGVVEGQLSLARQDTVTSARWSMDVTRAELSRLVRPPGSTAASNTIVPATNTTRWRKVWHEPGLRLSGAGQYDSASDSVQLERLEASSADVLKLSVSGHITQPLAGCSVDVQGRLTYDLARLVERLFPEGVSGLQVIGQDTQAFWLRGPLFTTVAHPSPDAGRLSHGSTAETGSIVPLALAGEAGLRWQAADLWGVAIGGGSLSAQLRTGTIESGTIETPLSGGRLRVTPHLQLSNASAVLTVDRGQVLQDVQISAAMCQGWLKYLAPLVADATRAEGRFSVTLNEARLPIRQPDEARVQGTLAIHSARIGPGPLALQWLAVGEQIKAALQRRLPSGSPGQQATWVTIPEQVTHFQLVDGRVHHDRLELQIGDVIVQTRGSVGLDQTLSLVAQVPIRNAWLSGDSRLARLAGQSVEIPISGTCQRPRLDQNALQRLTAQLIQQAAGQLLENELNKGLQQLFGPGR